MSRIFQISILFAICLTLSNGVFAQVSLNGATNCILPGREYTYTVSGNWSTTDIPQMQWCAPGTIQANQSTCITGALQIRVIYDGNFTGGTITFWSPSGSASLNVSTSAGPLKDGGYIGDGQTAYTDSIPSPLGAFAPTGGNCDGSGYVYQWEIAPAVSGPFTSIPGANEVFVTPPVSSTEKTVYIRRKTTYNGVSVYTTVCSLTYIHEPVRGGYVYINNSTYGISLPYGSTPVVTQLPGHGWQCSQSGISYRWWYKIAPAGTPQLIGTGVEYPANGPVISTNDIIIYRETICGSSSTNSNELYVGVSPLDPGDIYVDDTVVIAGIKPFITQSLAVGGRCDPASYQYLWQQSVNGTTWQNIGAGADYPAAAPAFTTNMRIRRQITCGAQTAYSNILYFSTFTEDFLADNRTFVVSNELRQAGITDTAAVAALTVGSKSRSTAYYDGLGRLSQTVWQQRGGVGKDVVQLKEYDAYGREENIYLPYTYTATNNRNMSSNGKYKVSGIADQQSFYQNKFPGEIASGKTIYELSPLSRPVINMSAGSSWVGSNRGKATSYQLNTAADQVRIWNITAGVTATPVTNKIYAAGALYKNTYTDEQGMKTVEYKNKDDQTILRKVQLADNASLSVGHDGWLCTYYVFDDVDNVRCIIPPKAVEAIKTTWVINQDILDGLCFQYQYDDKQRQTVKKNPGTKPVLLVYDHRDRVVFTQDGNMLAKKQWYTTLYDEMNRPVMTALYNKDITQQVLQTSLNSATGNLPLSNVVPGPGTITVAWYDGRSLYQAAESINFTDGFYSGSNASFEAILAPTSTTITVTANNPLPGLSSADLYPLIYTYYDDYGFAGSQPFQPSEMSSLENGDNSISPQVVTTPTNILRSAVTGVRTRILGTDQWLTSTRYYNTKAQVIQTIEDNISGARDITSKRYDFSGKLLSSNLHHSNLHSGTIPQTTVLTIFSYDAADRVLSIKKKLNGESTGVAITSNTYNDLGQSAVKIQGNNRNTQKVDYNVLGTIVGLNRQYVNNQEAGFFGYELAYDKTSSAISGVTYTNPQYTGNIAGATWKGSGDQRKYSYVYDNARRLLKADFLTNTAGSWNNSALDFSVRLGDGQNPALAYDANGNILTMKQKGIVGAQVQTIDSLKYGYTTASNQLSFVTDGRNNPQSLLGDFKEINNNETVDYTYDANGNLSKDANKSIAAIRYNHLNLPDSIAITGKGVIKYQYDASGNKQTKIVTDNTVTPTKVTTTDYIAGFVYQNDTLQFFGHEEGRVRTVFQPTQPVTFKYDYFVKDHLGNIRMVLTDQTDFTMYAATMEAPAAAKETTLFSNIDNTRVDKPVGYPADESAGSNASVAKLTATGSGKKIGPSIVLRVMAGDTIQIGAKAFYKSGGPKEGKSVAASAENMVADLVQVFNGSSGDGGNHGNAVSDQQTPFNTSFYNNDYQQLKEKEPDQQNVDRPKAYLNFVLFDDQFKLVEENSGVKQVKAEPDQLQTLGQDKMVIKKTGFLYAYTSNESTQDVFFDNIILGVNSGPLLEETHYYPFGLTMAGISSNALKGLNYPENRMKYNGKELQSKEFSDASGLEWYDYVARMYDVQIGRMAMADPHASNYYPLSPYSYVGNNPINSVDPDGRDIIVLNATSHVFGFGHAAVLIGNPKDGYRYYAKNGTYGSSGASGPSNKNPVIGVPYKSLEDFYASNDNKEDGPYDRAYELQTDKETDDRMAAAAEKAVKSDYEVLSQSCVDVASDALTQANKDPGHGYLFSPVKRQSVASMPAAPNSRFNNIVKNNEGGSMIYYQNNEITKPKKYTITILPMSYKFIYE
jgi:RHS repeat-associated protein